MVTDIDLSFKHATEVFDKYGLEYDIKYGGSMMWVSDGVGKVYAYYPTTHRWAPRSVKGKHYRAKSTEDFVQRFVLDNKERGEVFNDMLRYKFNIDTEHSSLNDLVDIIYDAFESGDDSYKVKGDVYKMLWGGIKKDD
jgi:hypothetical protein